MDKLPSEQLPHHSVAQSDAAEDTPAKWYEVRAPLHLGLSLKLMDNYSMDELRRRCKGDMVKLASLEAFFLDPAKLLEVPAPSAPASKAEVDSKRPKKNDIKQLKETPTKENDVMMLKESSAKKGDVSHPKVAPAKEDHVKQPKEKPSKEEDVKHPKGSPAKEDDIKRPKEKPSEEKDFKHPKGSLAKNENSEQPEDKNAIEPPAKKTRKGQAEASHLRHEAGELELPIDLDNPKFTVDGAATKTRSDGHVEIDIAGYKEFYAHFSAEGPSERHPRPKFPGVRTDETVHKRMRCWEDHKGRGWIAVYQPSKFARDSQLPSRQRWFNKATAGGGSWRLCFLMAQLQAQLYDRAEGSGLSEASSSSQAALTNGGNSAAAWSKRESVSQAVKTSGLAAPHIEDDGKKPKKIWGNRRKEEKKRRVREERKMDRLEKTDKESNQPKERDSMRLEEKDSARPKEDGAGRPPKEEPAPILSPPRSSRRSSRQSRLASGRPPKLIKGQIVFHLAVTPHRPARIIAIARQRKETPYLIRFLDAASEARGPLGDVFVALGDLEAFRESDISRIYDLIAISTPAPSLSAKEEFDLIAKSIAEASERQSPQEAEPLD